MIQTAFGWDDCHLWDFYFPNRNFRISEEENYADEWPECSLEFYLYPKAKMVYTYDYGDNWEVDIRVEKEVFDCKEYAEVIQHEGNQMREDCGGLAGYYRSQEEIELLDREEINARLKGLEEPKEPLIASFETVLQEYTKANLFELAEAHGMKKYKSCKKAELICRIKEMLLTKEYMEQVMDSCGAEEIALFEQAIKSGAVPVCEDMISSSLFLCSYGAWGDIGFYTVPFDVQELYRSICTPEYQERRRERWNLDAYCSSAVYLYGVIPVEKLAEIREHYRPQPDCRRQLSDFLKKETEKDGSGFAVKDGLLMDSELAEGNGYQKLLQIQGDRAYYIPEKEEDFLQYGLNGFQFPDEQMAEFLCCGMDELGMAEDEMSSLFIKVQELIRYQYPYEQIFDFMEEQGMRAVGLRKQKMLLEEIQKLSSYIRIRELRGFTQSEVSRQKKIIPFRTEKKVYPNAPCPCGSGKKYKQCCGRKKQN